MLKNNGSINDLLIETGRVAMAAARPVLSLFAFKAGHVNDETVFYVTFQ